MREMKRSDVREWIPGEPLERVDFGNGCTGMDKSIPKGPGQVRDFERLIWKCRAIEADGGPCLDVVPSEYWAGDVKQGDYFDVVTDGSSYGPCSFGGAWTYLAGVDTGWRLARRERHSGLCATLRGIFDSLTHRHENATDAEPWLRPRSPLANLLNTLRAAVPRLLLYLGQGYTARHVGRPPLNLEIIGKQQHRILAGEAGSSRKLLTNSILGRIQ